MPYSIASAVEIDRKLREDFRRRVKDFGIPTDTVDPVLAVLFRTFAQQIETLYADTGRTRLALLDELISGLGFDQRVSRPAQTVVRFQTSLPSQIVPSGVELIGEAQSGERLTFRTDASIQVSPARIALSLVYQNGTLRLPGSCDLPDHFQNLRPSLDPVRVNLGANPALYLAIENLPPDHLSLHSFFFELGADSFGLQQALENEPWCLVGDSGELKSLGVLRPSCSNAGVRALEWLVGQSTTRGPEPIIPAAAAVDLATGFYGPRLFVMPEIPMDRRWMCSAPRGMDGSLVRILGRESAAVLSQPRAWLRIGLPASVTGNFHNLETAIGPISLHAVTASNVECVNQTVYFDRHGTSIPISQEGGTANHLVAPLSVLGESGSPYVPESEPSSGVGEGRYAIRSGRVELHPARRPDGSNESFANVRVWVTTGSLGNFVGPGQVQSFAQKKDGAGLRLVNPTSAAGGVTAESLSEAQARFARTLLSRDRILTRQDLVTACRAYDHRIRDAESVSVLERLPSGLRRVQRIAIFLKTDDFVDPPAESRILEQDLARHLQARMLYDTHIALVTSWN